MFIKRAYYDVIGEKIAQGKVLIVYGPRQVGKTTLMRQWLKSQKGRVYSTTGEDLETAP